MNLLIINLRTDWDHSVFGFTTNWINTLSPHFEKIYVITLHKGTLMLKENVEVFTLGKEKKYGKIRILITFYKHIFKLLFLKKIDLCFVHMAYQFSILGWPIFKIFKIPIVLWYAHNKYSNLLKLAEFVSHEVVTSGESGFTIPSNKLNIIGQGIDTSKFKPPYNSRFRNNTKNIIITVGRISPIKNLHLAIVAFSKIPLKIRSNLELNFFGDPIGEEGNNYLNYLKDITNRLKLNGNVKFFPAVPFNKVQKEYQKATIFLNSSDTDSIDKTVLEAMSCGIPVITSNFAFLSVIPSKLSSYCLVKKNDPDDLTKKILKILTSSPKTRKKIGNTLRSVIIENHSLNSFIPKLCKVLYKAAKKSEK